MNQMDSVTFFSHLSLGFIHPNPKPVYVLQVNLLPALCLWCNIRSVTRVRQHQVKFSHSISERSCGPRSWKECGKNSEQNESLNRLIISQQVVEQPWQEFLTSVCRLKNQTKCNLNLGALTVKRTLSQSNDTASIKQGSVGQLGA